MTLNKIHFSFKLENETKNDSFLKESSEVRVSWKFTFNKIISFESFFDEKKKSCNFSQLKPDDFFLGKFDIFGK
jgi:hypothetical protein